MPLDNCPFGYFLDKTTRPYLQVKIGNPHSDSCCIATHGLIDTGADECAVPAIFADILGHDLQKGVTKTIGTGNGLTTVYIHTTTFEIYHPCNKTTYSYHPQNPNCLYAKS